MTEWERQRETEEFTRAANLYRPLSGLMASRFVTAKHNDEDTVEVAAEEGVGMIMWSGLNSEL